MNQAQPGIFHDTSRRLYFLEYQLRGNASLDQLKAALNAARQPVNGGIQVVTAFGKRAWETLQPAWSPTGLKDFEEIVGVGQHRAPATQRDVLFWIHGDHQGDNFDQVLKIQQQMSVVAELALDLPGFVYHDSRDLTGFVDGSANPEGDDRFGVALIPQGEAGAGGSYVLSQKWVHKLDQFKQMPVHEQEQVIGRTKPDSIELEGDDMPPTAHVARTDVKLDGEALKIYRRSGPYGTAAEQGLYFIAFSCDLARYEVMLKRMYGIFGDGYADRLLEFSTPLTGSYWFAPSIEDLDRSLAIS